MFFNANRRVFDLGIRDSGGIPQARPAWVADPSVYPIKTLPWGAYLDARDNTAITLDGSSKVSYWKSSVPSIAFGQSGLPYYFALRGEGEGIGNPSVNGGTGTPSGAQFISFNGTSDRMRSGARSSSTNLWAYGNYSGTFGAGTDQGLWLNSFALEVSPTACAFTGLWRTDSFAIPTWSGVASAGTSGGNNLANGSGFIQPGTGVNNYVAVDFANGGGGTNYFAGGILSDYITASSWAMYFVAYFNTAVADPGPGARASAPCLFNVDNNVFNIAYTDSGVTVEIQYPDLSFTTLTVACATGAWHLIRVWYDGSDYHLQVDGTTASTETNIPVADLTGNVFMGIDVTFAVGLDCEMLEFGVSNSYAAVAFDGIGVYVQDRYGIDIGSPGSFYQYTAADVPAPTGGPRSDGVNDYLDSNLRLQDVFATDGSEGTLTFAWYGDGATVLNPGTTTAQTPYANDCIFADAGGYFLVAFTTSGITVGAYDGVPRDSGGGPGSNDGWQMVTVALSLTTDALVQVRWGVGTVLEVRVSTAAGVGTWQSCAFSAINAAGLPYKLRLQADYSITRFAKGIIYQLGTRKTRMNNEDADDEVRYFQASIGGSFGWPAIGSDSWVPLGGPAPGGGYTPGFASFAVVRANNRTTTPSGYLAQNVWSLTSYWLGLGSTTQGGVAKLTSFAFDSTGGTDYNVNETAVDDTWHLSTTRYEALTLKARRDGLPSTDTSIVLPSDPNDGSQPMWFGYGAGSGLYFSGGLAFWGSVPTNGWSSVRVADVEAYLNKVFLQSNGQLYDVTLGPDNISVTDSLARNAEFGRPISDTATVTDALTRNAEYGRALSDTGTVTDALTRNAEFGRLPSDTASVTDTSTLNAEYGRSGTDTITVSETSTTNAEFLRTGSDTVSVTDSVALTIERSPSDSITITEALTKNVEYGRVLSDTATATDSVALTVERSPSDSVSVTDSLSAGSEFGRTLGDTATITDSTTINVEYARALSDTASITDSTTLTSERSPADSVSVTDSVANSVEYGRVLADSASVADSTALTVERSPSDSVSVSDSVANSADYSRTGTDTASVTDSIATGFEYARALSDSASVTDSLTNNAEYGRLLTDSATVTDSTSLTNERSPSDSITVTDSIQTGFEYSRLLSDSASVTDSTALTIERSPADTATITDTTSNAVEYARTLSDTATATDSTALTIERSPFDSVSVTDSTSRSAEFGRVAADAASVTDVATISVEYLRTLTDTITITDTSANDSEVEVNDSASVTDSLKTNAEFLRALTDSASVTDSVALEVGRSPTDTITVTDSLARSAEYGRTASDTASVSDSTALTIERSPFDSVSLADATSLAAEYARNLSDTVSVTDSIAFGQEIQITPSDSIAVTDGTTVNLELLRALTDSVSTTETTTTEAQYSRTGTDTISVTDSTAAGRDRATAFSDSISVTDSLFRTAELGRILSDVADLTELVSTQVIGTIALTLTDSISATDALTTSADYARAFTDTAAVTDSAALSADRAVASSDSVSVVDVTTTSATIGLGLSDVADVSDQIAPQLYRMLLVSASDSCSVTDLGSTSLSFGVSLTDAVSASDVAFREVVYARDLFDPATITDVTRTEQSIALALFDLLDVEDDINADLGTLVDLIFNVTGSSSVTFKMPGRVNLNATFQGRVAALFALGTVRQRPTPSNEPYNGPQITPTNGSGYRYLIVAPQAVVPPNASLAATAGSSYQAIETELLFRGVRADGIRLPSGIRVYRIHERDVWKLQQDKRGAYLQQNQNTRYDLILSDPTIGQPTPDDWKPIY